MITIFCIEASQQIGLGHLMESLILAEHLVSQNIPVHCIINPYQPSRQELQKRQIPFTECSHEAVHDIIRLVQQKQARVVVVNQRNVSIKILSELHGENVLVVVIDQFGNKSATCDLLVNKSIVPQWLQYDFSGCYPICCFGSKYAILQNSYRKIHKYEKTFSRNKCTVLVSMGGVDRTGATLRIIEALKHLNEVSKEIVIGSGFAHMEKLQKIRKGLNTPSFSFYQGINNLGEQMSKADIVISAGGNTLYEIACAGTPGIVLWEDEHEYIQGRAFSEKGIVLCLGNGINTSIKEISESIRALLNNTEQRKYMSQCGKRMVNAQGTELICTKIKELNLIKTGK